MLAEQEKRIRAVSVESALSKANSKSEDPPPRLFENLKKIVNGLQDNINSSGPSGEGGGGGGGLIGEEGLLEREAYLKFIDRQRQNLTMFMEFELLCSFNNNYELLRYITDIN